MILPARFLSTLIIHVTFKVWAYVAYDLWQQLQVASKLESDLRDTVDC